KAKKEGYEQIAAIFQETADNEKEHAKLWFKLLNGGEIGTTAENLKAAALKILEYRYFIELARLWQGSRNQHSKRSTIARGLQTVRRWKSKYVAISSSSTTSAENCAASIRR
ncbi:MAG: hypothetical protein IKA48_11865, partial [Fibrobacter sp.]|nr:hypothetical protein [Fibrobacter sp.]